MEISIDVETKVIKIIYKDTEDPNEVTKRATRLMQHMRGYRMDIIPLSDPSGVFSTDL
jgi:hypothetical protein